LYAGEFDTDAPIVPPGCSLIDPTKESDYAAVPLERDIVIPPIVSHFDAIKTTWTKVNEGAIVMYKLKTEAEKKLNTQVWLNMMKQGRSDDLEDDPTVVSLRNKYHGAERITNDIASRAESLFELTKEIFETYSNNTRTRRLELNKSFPPESCDNWECCDKALYTVIRSMADLTFLDAHEALQERNREFKIG
jgi:hypothetical protein